MEFILCKYHKTSMKSSLPLINFTESRQKTITDLITIEGYRQEPKVRIAI